jgi:predicted transglutaminase-like cysteine proteinase
MGIFGKLHAWRAVAIACGLFWLGSASNLRAEAPDAPEMAQQPFGLSASPVVGGGVQQKWLSVQRRLDDELVQLALCDGDRDGCVSPAALRLLALVDAARAREGRARIGEINRAVNLSIKAVSDLAQYGEVDLWTSPLVTFGRGAGDCEDYAIAKFVALRLAGIGASNLRIVIVHDPLRGEDHAIAAARLDGRWLTLDNRRMAMVEDIDAKNYRPLFVLDDTGAMRYETAPLLAGLPRPAPTLSIAAAPSAAMQTN